MLSLCYCLVFFFAMFYSIFYLILLHFALWSRGGAHFLLDSVFLTVCGIIGSTSVYIVLVYVCRCLVRITQCLIRKSVHVFVFGQVHMCINAAYAH